MKEKTIKLIKQGFPYYLIIIMSCLIISPQIISQGVILGTDSIFHFNRFYETAQQIRYWNFSYFQSNYSFQQSGRIINATYCPLFAYFNGIILLFARSWYRYQIITNLLIYFIGGTGMYKLCIKLHSKQSIALITAFIYMNIGWLPRWELAQNMNAWGAALSPYMIICGIRMIQNSEQPINVLQLMTVMTIIMQIHLLSSVFFVVALIPFFIAGLIHSNNPRLMWIDLLKAVIGTIILTANIWGALLMINLNNHIAYPANFNLFANALRPATFSNNRRFLSFFIWFLFTAQFIFVIRKPHRSSLNTFITSWGFLILILSSVITPWKKFQQWLPFLSHTLQFPSRLTIIAYPLLFAGIAMTITTIVNSTPKYSLSRNSSIGILVVTLLLVFIPTNITISKKVANYYSDALFANLSALAKVSTNKAAIRYSTQSSHPGQLLSLVEKRSPDYLPLPSNYAGNKSKHSYDYQSQIIKNANNFHHTVLKGGKLKITWTADHSGTKRLPLVTYHESVLTVNGRRVTHYQRSSIGAPYVHEHQGLNTATLRFKPASWFNYLLVIWLISLSIYWVYGSYTFYKHRIA
ncbi:cell division protein [Limosilactobacillus fastidiosus]|uniref:Cell division protein n=2 Tax=Limosilactobacillus fastidiosus TaxID=2759855 RepID=A0A7W3YC68_9LACO|nr:cell division protein [Limosilactobacillus fastidiosus]MBB1086444.1 cell division protein [Limosilactobacillus fastidiosus]MCD7086324.1 cell division protein [Limosilactobacillus fastidiosus]MCD7114895.1 cell division protein [Limosilactobacillus fastidiosus]MCD7116887.1 cell division protein [Limosilactobacillus fastidiosus]